MLLENVQNVNDEQACKQFKYRLVKRPQIKLPCYSFAFSQNSVLLFAGCGNGFIKVYEFNNSLKLLQTLSNDQDQDKVLCLLFVKKSNQLISRCGDQSIIIWNQNQNNQWYAYETIETFNSIACMILNEKEDQLITGSFNDKITFWKKKNSSWDWCSQTIDVPFMVYGLSLNASQTKLIACLHKYEIKVLELQPNQQWIIAETIQIDNKGERICFTKENQFVFQQQNGDSVIYDYDTGKKQFIKKQEIQGNKSAWFLGFPSQFIMEKNILFLNFVKHIDFFGIHQSGQYLLQQSIANNQNIMGRLTDDGNILVTCNENYQGIQIRKLQYLE